MRLSRDDPFGVITAIEERHGIDVDRAILRIKLRHRLGIVAIYGQGVATQDLADRALVFQFFHTSRQRCDNFVQVLHRSLMPIYGETYSPRATNAIIGCALSDHMSQPIIERCSGGVRYSLVDPSHDFFPEPLDVLQECLQARMGEVDHTPGHACFTQSRQSLKVAIRLCAASR